MFAPKLPPSSSRPSPPPNSPPNCASQQLILMKITIEKKYTIIYSTKYKKYDIMQTKG